MADDWWAPKRQVLDTERDRGKTQRMRVVGYVRELSDRSHGGSIFAQSERIRRWSSEQGYQLLAMCQDVRSPSGEPLDEGFRALLEIVGAGHADAIVVPSLEAFSSDLLIQEVILQDLRDRGVRVISTAEADVEVLADARVDAARLLIRDVLARRAEYERAMGTPASPDDQIVAGSEGDVVIELIPAQSA
ncbi:MAG: recombinase family protein [Actinobacteria bacterium]|nr:recombinase family protein [Actinomycetota bacterium]